MSIDASGYFLIVRTLATVNEWMNNGQWFESRKCVDLDVGKLDRRAAILCFRYSLQVIDAISINCSGRWSLIASGCCAFVFRMICKMGVFDFVKKILGMFFRWFLYGTTLLSLPLFFFNSHAVDLRCVAFDLIHISHNSRDVMLRDLYCCGRRRSIHYVECNLTPGNTYPLCRLECCPNTPEIQRFLLV